MFLFFGRLAWVAVGVLLYFRRKTLRKTELMRRVETSAAAEAKHGTRHPGGGQGRLAV